MSKKVKDFRPASRNANKHTARGMGALQKSIQSDGWIGAMTTAADGEMIAGSARIETVAQVFGTDAEPIIVESDGTRPVVVVRTDIATADDKRAQRLALADNRVQEIDLTWDVEVLAGLDADVLEGLWTPDELSDLGQQWADEQRGKQEDAGAQIDKAEELRVKWGVESGQLWQLGEHRLICGDCTEKATVARVMGGEKAQLCFTSPPYVQQRDYGQKIEDWDTLMFGMSDALPVADNGQVLVNLGIVHRDREWQPYWDKWIEYMRASGWLRFGWYVWDKLDGMPGDYHGRLWPAHEWIFHFVTVPSKHAGEILHKTVPSKHAGEVPKITGNRKPDGSFTAWTGAGDPVQSMKVHDSVFRLPPAKGGVEGHPAPFPVRLPEEVIPIFSDRDATVYDPFLGSGTTLIACERLGRKCRAVEISPGYCAVAIERWAQTTGGTPILANGA